MHLIAKMQHKKRERRKRQNLVHGEESFSLSKCPLPKSGLLKRWKWESAT